MKKEEDQTYRIGYFSDGLELYETVSESVPNRKLSFEINLEQSKLRDTPTDQHILKSKNFRFESISYTLEPVSDKETLLLLTCNYQVNSKMNWYARIWADLIITDFEKRLLSCLKLKIEKEHAPI